MDIRDGLQLFLFIALLILLAKPIGVLLSQALDPRGKTPFDLALKPIENRLYRWMKIDPLEEQDWKEYLIHMLGFGFLSFLFTAFFLGAQHYLPLNPQKFSAPSWHLNLNTAISFLTNTNWQSYGGESTLSYLAQMAGLTVQNFVSPAVSLSTAAALVRGISRHTARTVGNFWTDLIRVILYVLLPISLIAATLLMFEGVPQNFKSYITASTLEGGSQTIAQGPVASQEAIKMLGSNGGGFFNVNSAHPYENPTPLTNFFEMLLILLLPVAQLYYFGRQVKDMKHAWYIGVSLGLYFLFSLLICSGAEAIGNPEWASFGIEGGNMEGKELRFGLFNSALFACATTSVSCGAVNAMHDSFTPIGGLIPMLNMQLGECIFGGAGAGLYSVLAYVILAIFVAGLMVGRTPEYLGKKIESFEVKMTVIALLSYVILVLSFVGWAGVSGWGIAGLGNAGPHGFSEILYAYSSAAANNGSAFAGLNANAPLYDTTLAFCMLMGRYLFIAPILAMSGSLAAKKIHPVSAGSFPVSNLIFISLLIGIILLQGALTFLPAITLGPILEQFFMLKGAVFP